MTPVSGTSFRSSKKGHAGTLSFEERQKVASRLASIIYKMGSIPHEDPPEDSYQDLFDYTNLTESLEMLLKDNPKFNVFLYKGDEALQVGARPVQFDVYHALLVPLGETPPLWLDTLNGGEEYVSFKELSLEWKNLKDFKDDLLQTWSKTILRDRVFVLKCNSRRWRNIDDEKKALFMKRCMLDCRRSIFPPSEYAGMIKFTCSIAGVELKTECNPTDSLKEQVQFVVDEFGDEGVEVDAEGKAYIKETIRGAVLQKEVKIENLVEEIHNRHDMKKVDETFAAKIFPGNVQVVIPEATRTEMRLHLARWVAQDEAALANQAQQIEAMENALQDYTFRASTQVGAYGPAQKVFAGADYVHQEMTETDYSDYFASFANWKPKTTDGDNSEAFNGNESDAETAANEA